MRGVFLRSSAAMLLVAGLSTAQEDDVTIAFDGDDGPSMYTAKQTITGSVGAGSRPLRLCARVAMSIDGNLNPDLDATVKELVHTPPPRIRHGSRAR
jgi:hypothetical protein